MMLRCHGERILRVKGLLNVKVRHRAEDAAEERILDALLPPARTFGEEAGG